MLHSHTDGYQQFHLLRHNMASEECRNVSPPSSGSNSKLQATQETSMKKETCIPCVMRFSLGSPINSEDGGDKFVRNVRKFHLITAVA
jgi:hypothetical protein